MVLVIVCLIACCHRSRKTENNWVRAKPSKEVDFNGDGWKALESNVEKAQLT